MCWGGEILSEILRHAVFYRIFSEEKSNFTCFVSKIRYYGRNATGK